MPSSSSSFLSGLVADDDCFLLLSSCPCCACCPWPLFASDSRALTNSSMFPVAAALTASGPKPNWRMTGLACPDCKADQNIDSAWENWGDDSVVERLSPGGKCTFMALSKLSVAEIAVGMALVSSVATPLCRIISCAIAERKQQTYPEKLPQLLNRTRVSDSQEKFRRRIVLNNKKMPLPFNSSVLFFTIYYDSITIWLSNWYYYFLKWLKLCTFVSLLISLFIKVLNNS